jgi:hypothetical protein
VASFAINFAIPSTWKTAFAIIITLCVMASAASRTTIWFLAFINICASAIAGFEIGIAVVSLGALAEIPVPVSGIGAVAMVADASRGYRPRA